MPTSNHSKEILTGNFKTESCFVHGIFLSQSLLTSQSLRATIGPLQFSLRHWNLRNLTLHSGMLPYKHASRSLEIFSANTVLSHGSIMLPPHQPRVFARLARWQLDTTNSRGTTLHAACTRKFLRLTRSKI